MEKKYIDLHMHSSYSDDGEFSPSQLVDMCAKAGIKIMAIADHNWVKAIDEAKQRADEKCIRFIPAIEIDCTFKGTNLHVLGYGINYLDQVFKQLGEDVMKQELACSMQKLVLTNQLGFDLHKDQLDKLSKNGVYTGEMFGEVLLNDPRYQNHELLIPYRRGGSRSDNPYVNFYWDYYAQGKPCYTDIVFPDLQDIIRLINRHGGVAVLAHPGNNLKGHFELFDEMVKIGLQGVECFSSYHDKTVNEYFYQKAKEYDMLMTCGSDFHGKTKPAIHLGENGCDNAIEIEQQLRKYRLI